MAYSDQIGLPAAEPVSLATVKNRLKLPAGFTLDDTLITQSISAAREDGERCSGLMLARRQFIQVLDSFPYYTDTIQSQLAYPPSYYSLPRYSTTLWNYSQMIKLSRSPLISVDGLTYIGTDGLEHTLEAGKDFIVDPETKLARLFPMPGQYWPAVLYTPNAVKILYTAGYSNDPTEETTFGLPSPPPAPPNQQTNYQVLTGIPYGFIDLISALAVFRYQYPAETIPAKFETAFMALGILDFAPTRG